MPPRYRQPGPLGASPATLALPLSQAAKMRARIARIAQGYVGSARWREDTGKGVQCSTFVNDVLGEAGCAPGLLHKTRGYYWDQFKDEVSHLISPHGPHIVSTHQYPPLAGDWANPGFEIPNWVVVRQGPAQAQPGDIVAEAINYSDATGHVGIVIATGQTASADSTASPPGLITATNYGFRPDDDPNKHGHASKCVVRRYLGDQP
jgi:cell wall-associated NlpC family hydrolase